MSEEGKYRPTYDHRKANGQIRSIGSTDICQRCGQEYIVKGAIQKYCSLCAKKVIIERSNVAQHQRLLSNPEYKAEYYARYRRTPKQYECAICGKLFTSKCYAFTCGGECQALYKLEYDAAYRHVIRADGNIEENRARWQAIKTEMQQQIICNAREKYQKRRKNDETQKVGE